METLIPSGKSVGLKLREFFFLITQERMFFMLLVFSKKQNKLQFHMRMSSIIRDEKKKKKKLAHNEAQNLVLHAHVIPEQSQKHIIIRFCCLCTCAATHRGDKWSQREQNREGCIFLKEGVDTEREEERCPVLLSRLSVTAEEEQRKLVGCGVSHVRLTLSDSLLCYSLTHSVHSLGEMCYSSASVLSSAPPPFFLFLFSVYSLQLPSERSVGLQQVEGRPIGEFWKKTMTIPKGKQVTGGPAHPTPVPWRQGRVNRVEGGEWHTCPLRKLQIEKWWKLKKWRKRKKIFSQLYTFIFFLIRMSTCKFCFQDGYQPFTITVMKSFEVSHFFFWTWPVFLRAFGSVMAEPSVKTDHFQFFFSHSEVRNLSFVFLYLAYAVKYLCGRIFSYKVREHLLLPVTVQ